MNIPFLNPTEYLNQHPSVLLATVPFTDEHTVTSMRFSHSGNYLALGRSNGSVLLFDVESRGILRRFESDIVDNEDENVISELLWLYDESGDIEKRYASKIQCGPLRLLRTGAPSSENPLQTSSRFLVASAYSGSGTGKGHILIWDILNESSKPIVQYEFKEGVSSLDLFPLGNQSKLLVSFYDVEPLILDILTDEQTKIPIEPKKNDYIIARYNKVGDRIYCGSVKGDLTILDSSTLKLISRFEIESGKCIYDIQFSVKGKYYLVNAGGLVKVYHALTDSFQFDVKSADMEVRQHYWCGFSGLGPIVASDADSSFLFGACKSTVYIWSRSQGFELAALTPIKQRTTIIRVAWHPTKPLLVCAGNDSNLYFYTIPVKDNWSAFAPGFEEVEINDEYIEREDEYDDELVEEEKRRQEKDLDVLDDMREVIDILTLDKANEQSILECYVPLKLEQDKWLEVMESQNVEYMKETKKSLQVADQMSDVSPQTTI